MSIEAVLLVGGQEFERTWVQRDLHGRPPRAVSVAICEPFTARRFVDADSVPPARPLIQTAEFRLADHLALWSRARVWPRVSYTLVSTPPTGFRWCMANGKLWAEPIEWYDAQGRRQTPRHGVTP